MSIEDTQPMRAPFRLAFREEGEMVNCYFASNETMEGAMLMASMRKNFLNDQVLWARYRELMQDVLRIAIKQTLGTDPTSFELEPAPQHERAGHS
jgi:hypothetical protein